ncbi:hypothetical protein FB451DRAFT_1369491 [Mycena latifolia]|nr:hypothetical protein FB451DRAFT_1369491 [Mycena latifolia]
MAEAVSWPSLGLSPSLSLIATSAGKSSKLELSVLGVWSLPELELGSETVLSVIVWKFLMEHEVPCHWWRHRGSLYWECWRIGEDAETVHFVSDAFIGGVGYLIPRLYLCCSARYLYQVRRPFGPIRTYDWLSLSLLVDVFAVIHSLGRGGKGWTHVSWGVSLMRKASGSIGGDSDKTGVCLSGASNVLAANSKSKTRVPCLFGGDESRCFDKARQSFNNRKRIDLIVDNEYNSIYGPEQTTSTVLTVYMVDLGLVNPSGRNGNRPNELYKHD